MTCSWISTLLDQEQIERSIAIAGRPQDVETLPDRAGMDVAAELGNRYLLRYLTSSQVSEFTGGSTDRDHWVTPTALSPQDVVSWLALFAPKQTREHLLLLDASEIDVIRGPVWIRLGAGIEYYLPNGFPRASIVDVGVLQVR